MDNLPLQVGIELLKIGGTLVAAYAAARFAIIKFHQERKWDRLSESYGQILEALIALQWQAEVEESREYNPDLRLYGMTEDELDKRTRAAQDRIDATISAGAWTISEKAWSVLSDMRKELHSAVKEYRDGPRFDYYIHRGQVFKRTISDIRALAKAELEALEKSPISKLTGH